MVRRPARAAGCARRNSACIAEHKGISRQSGNQTDAGRRRPAGAPVSFLFAIMSRQRFHNQVARLLEQAGIRINGPAACDIQVQDTRFYGRVLAHGSIGLGESYMDGWWEAGDLDGFLYRLLRARLDERVRGWEDVLGVLHAKLFNLQKRSRAFQVGQYHYDMGNDLYRLMLGRRLVYSCGYWRNADNLDAAQEAKLDLVFRKLGLQPGMRVLDIGCGWGEALQLAAERYGVSGVGVTVSQQQADYARQLCKGLPVEIRLQDYRALDERFDRIFSIGMFEHVGVKNYRIFMRVVRRCLADDGLFLLHTIGGNRSVNITDPWIARYIFPNGMVPSMRQISRALEGLFVCEDWHNFSAYYDKTLLAWRHNFEAGWSTLKQTHDTRFYRMWRYYLSAAAAAFRSRHNQLWQLVLSPHGVPSGYVAPR